MQSIWYSYYKDRPPIPTQSLEQALRLILKENSFQFDGKNYLETHRTALGTKVAVAFANIFITKVQTQLLNKRAKKPICWKRYIGNIFSLWDTGREEITHFIEQANNHHATIKFTAEISEDKVTFLDTIIIVYKGESFNSMLILDVGTHFKPTETFQYTHLYILPPIRGQEGLNKRRSPQATHNKFLKRKLSKRTRLIPKAP